MKIFSNFDTCFRRNKVREYQNKYGIDKVFAFGRSRLYRILKILLPLLLLLVISFFLLVLFNLWIWKIYIKYAIISIVIVDIFFLFPIIWKYIEYKMDFIIVTSESIIMYDQIWLFKKNVLTIKSKSIKSICIERKIFLYSVFNNWDLTFLSEAISNNNYLNYWEMTLRWVAKPEKKRDKIVKIIHIN